MPRNNPALGARAMMLAAVACTALLTGCATTSAGPDGLYAAPIGDAPVTANPTPYSGALTCLGEWARANRRPSPRIAVGRIADYTGKQEPEGGFRVTQGGTLMAISALAKSGARLVERYDTSVSDVELRMANDRLITDSAAPDPARPNAYRPIMPGVVAGSTYYLIGGVTELNFNIRSSGVDALAGERAIAGPKARFTNRTYVMNVGLDLRLVDTRTSEVVDVVSYQKQIVGREISAGVFSFLGGSVIDLSGGEGGLEPLQLAVRSLIERATLELMSNLYGAPGAGGCLGSADPLATPVAQTASASSAAAVPAAEPTSSHAAAPAATAPASSAPLPAASRPPRRLDPSRWG
jgi:curli production assembly/transport component CsgG/holdfast attachment protein HfaB